VSATREAIAATLRGKAAVTEVRDLLERLTVIDADIEQARDVVLPIGERPFQITAEEYHDVLARRRDAVLRRLENKGIRVAPDPEPALAHPVITEDAKASA